MQFMLVSEKKENLSIMRKLLEVKILKQHFLNLHLRTLDRITSMLVLQIPIKELIYNKVIESSLKYI